MGTGTHPETRRHGSAGAGTGADTGSIATAPFPDSGPSGGRRSLPGILLRVEGLALLALSVLLYADRDASWLLFVVLILAPDLSMLGYLAGNRTGAAIYNLAHTWTLPVALGGAGLLADSNTLIALALIWAAHIGLDRAVGYGLKYPDEFKSTHLNRV